MQKYWICVLPKDRVLAGIEGNFIQSQQQEAPLSRMKKGDWIIFYSPRNTAEDTEKVQAFIALGQLIDEIVYQVDVTSEVKGFRRKIEYTKCKEASVIPLIQHLSFIRNKKHWGFVFKLSLIQILEEDFMIICKSME